MTQPTIRHAHPDDLSALTALRNWYIDHSFATFDESHLSPAAMQAWLAQFQGTGPHQLLVAFDGDRLLGYCCSQSYRPHPAFRQTIETSIYIDPDVRRGGVGTALYSTLFKALEGQDLHRAVVGIALPNEASVALHRKFGYRPIGIYDEYALKNGRHVSSQWMERKMRQAELSPSCAPQAGVTEPARDFSALTLQTPRLVLRPLRDSDAASLFAIFSDPEFMRYWSSTPWTSIDQATALIARDQRELAQGEHLRLGIFLRDTQALVGTCSLFDLDWGCCRGEVGYGIARPHWRQGLMNEAVSALIDHAFGALKLHRLEADIDPRNTASARSLEKLGFVREGLLRERWIVGSETSDSALYGLLAHEWLAAGVAEPVVMAP